MIRYNEEEILNLNNVLILQFSKGSIGIEYTNKEIDCLSDNVNEKFVNIKVITKKILKEVSKGHWMKLNNGKDITFINIDNVSEFHISKDNKKVTIYANDTISVYISKQPIIYTNFNTTKFIKFNKDNMDIFLNKNKICNINYETISITIFFVDHTSEFNNINIEKFLNQLKIY